MPYCKSQTPASCSPQAGDLHVLRGLCTQISVGGLDGLEHTGNLASGSVNLGNGEDSRALQSAGLLHILLQQLLGISAGGQSHSIVIAGGATTALGNNMAQVKAGVSADSGLRTMKLAACGAHQGLEADQQLCLPQPACLCDPAPNQHSPQPPAHLGVQEGGAAVGGHGEVTREGVEGALGIQLLDGEQEGHTLTTGQLHGDRGVVNAVLLNQLHVAATDLEVSSHLRKFTGGVHADEAPNQDPEEKVVHSYAAPASSERTSGSA